MTAPQLPTLPAAPTPTRQPRRRRFWLGAITATLLVLVAAWFWLVPSLVAAALRSQLRGAGFAEVELAAVDVALGQIVVHQVRLGSLEPSTGQLTIATVVGTFALADLWHARLDTVVLDQPIWTTAPSGGNPASPFDALLRAADHEATPAPTAARGPVLPQLPVRLVQIRAGKIVPGANSSLPATQFEATLRAEATVWHLDLEAVTAGQAAQATIELAPQDARAIGTVALRLRGPQPLLLDGECELGWQTAGRQLRMALQRRPGPFDVALANDRWSGDGHLALQTTVPFANLAAATFAVHADELQLASSAGVAITGIATDFQLQGLPVPTTTGGQPVTWRSLTLANIQAGSGSAQVDLRPGPELQISLHQRALDEVGTLDVHDLRLTEGLPTTPITLEFGGMPLQGLLEFVSQGRITGEGRLSGSLSLVVRTEPKLGIDLRHGRLTAAPGGVVRMVTGGQGETMVRQQIEQVVASTGQDAAVQSRLVQALQEFTYKALDFRIVPAASAASVDLQVHVVGTGRQVPQQLELDLNLHGLDTAIDTAFALSFGLDRAQDRLRRRLQPPVDHPTAPKKPS